MHLAINIDHVATLRNARGGSKPDPVEAARICEEAGAVGIVCHLREDRRHIKDDDVFRLRSALRTKLDLEMAATEEIIAIACEVKPDLVTLVPERRQELTTERGIDVVAQMEFYTDVVKRFHDHSIQVSLFIDPVEEQVRAAAKTGTDMIELHTGEYAEAKSKEEQNAHLQSLRLAAALGVSLGMGVNAGHGLDYENTAAIAALREIREVSIGYAVVVRALEVGLANAVREMRAIVEAASLEKG